MRVGHRYLDSYWFYLPLLLSLVSCSQSTGLPPQNSSPEFDNPELVSEIKSYSSRLFSIQEVIQEGGALRVNIILKNQPENQPELRRLTMNALFEIQVLTGEDTRLSVWNWKPDSGEFTGYAFYSPFDKSYHFKLPGGSQ